ASTSPGTDAAHGQRTDHGWRFGLLCGTSCRRCLVELFGDGRPAGRDGYFVVIPATTKVHDLLVVRILEDSREVPLAEALAVAAEQFEGAYANVAGVSRVVGSFNQRLGSPSDEIERLGPRQALARAADDCRLHRGRFHTVARILAEHVVERHGPDFADDGCCGRAISGGGAPAPTRAAATAAVA